MWNLDNIKNQNANATSLSLIGSTPAYRLCKQSLQTALRSFSRSWRELMAKWYSTWLLQWWSSGLYWCTTTEKEWQENLRDIQYNIFICLLRFQLHTLHIQEKNELGINYFTCYTIFCKKQLTKQQKLWNSSLIIIACFKIKLHWTKVTDLPWTEVFYFWIIRGYYVVAHNLVQCKMTSRHKDWLKNHYS